MPLSNFISIFITRTAPIIVITFILAIDRRAMNTTPCILILSIMITNIPSCSM